MAPEPGQRFTDEGIPITDEDPETRPAIETQNKYLVAGNHKTLTVMLPVTDATPDEILLHAAWLVTMAEPFAARTFEDYQAAVRAT